MSQDAVKEENYVEIENPFKYNGPLDPRDSNVFCVERSRNVNEIINGIKKMDYWAVLGPRQIGKTTLLFQVQDKFHDPYYVYFSFQVSHKNLYVWLRDEMLEKIPSVKHKKYKEWDENNPEVSFIDFLKVFKAKDESRKIVLLFDEIDGLDNLESFLRLWRTVYITRQGTKELRNYVAIVTGSVELISLTIEKTSPFNIAKTLYLKDFSVKESEKIIDKFFDKKIKKSAKNKLLSQISGHPQLLQHACSLLFDMNKNSNPVLTKKDVQVVIEQLLEENQTLDTLRKSMESNDELKQLLRNILKRKKIRFHPNKEFSFWEAGAITKKNDYCKIRNNVFKKVIEDYFKNINAVCHTASYDNTSEKKKLMAFELAIVIISIILGFISLKTDSSAGLGMAFVLAVIALILYFMRKD